MKIVAVAVLAVFIVLRYKNALNPSIDISSGEVVAIAAAIVQAVATIALVLITKGYAKKTGELAEQGKKNLELRMTPVVGLSARLMTDAELNNVRPYAQGKIGVKLKFVNLGEYPILKVVPHLLDIEEKDNIGSNVFFQYIKPSKSKTICPVFSFKEGKNGISEVVVPELQNESLCYGKVYRKYHIYLTCKNILGKTYRIDYDKNVDVGSRSLPSDSWYYPRVTEINE